MLYINLSSDLIYITQHKETTTLSLQNIEHHLPQTLVRMLRESNEKDVCILNGPGSFTTLRLGCLILNEINILFDNTLRFRSCTKIELYTLAYRAGFLPRRGYIYIGQKNNVRKVDFETGMETKLPCTEGMATEDIYVVDTVQEHSMLTYLNNDFRLKNTFEENSIHLTYRGHTRSFSIHDLCPTPLPHVAPAYLIEPSLGPTVS